RSLPWFRAYLGATSGGLCSPVFSPQLCQQALGLLKISRVKALGDPAVDRCQQLVGLTAPALLLPQPTQAHSGAQLPGFRLLAARDREGLTKPLFDLRQRGRLPVGLASVAVLGHELPLEPKQHYHLAPIPGPVNVPQGPVPPLLPLTYSPVCAMRPRRNATRIRLVGICGGRPMGRSSLTHPVQAVLGLSLLAQSQPAAEHPARPLEGKPLGGCQGEERVCPLARDLEPPA